MKGIVQACGRWGPFALSTAALLIIAGVFATGWGRALKDEGAAAHLWQLAIVLQVPLIGAYIATADWKRPGAAARVIGLQAGALALAMAPVALMRL